MLHMNEIVYKRDTKKMSYLSYRSTQMCASKSMDKMEEIKQKFRENAPIGIGLYRIPHLIKTRYISKYSKYHCL